MRCDDDLAEMLLLIVNKLDKAVEVLRVNRSQNVVEDDYGVFRLVMFRQCEEHAKPESVQMRLAEN